MAQACQGRRIAVNSRLLGYRARRIGEEEGKGRKKRKGKRRGGKRKKEKTGKRKGEEGRKGERTKGKRQ